MRMRYRFTESTEKGQVDKLRTGESLGEDLRRCGPFLNAEEIGFLCADGSLR